MGGYRFRRGSTRGLAGAEQRSLARNQGTKLAAAAAQRFSHVLGEAWRQSDADVMCFFFRIWAFLASLHLLCIMCIPVSCHLYCATSHLQSSSMQATVPKSGPLNPTLVTKGLSSPSKFSWEGFTNQWLKITIPELIARTNAWIVYHQRTEAFALRRHLPTSTAAKHRCLKTGQFSWPKSGEAFKLVETASFSRSTTQRVAGFQNATLVL